MKKFIVDLITNRFGIVLATLNVCYFVSRKFVYYAFSHGNNDECMILKHQAFSLMKLHYAETILNINSPAALASLLQGKFMQSVFPDFCVFTHLKIQIVFLIFFITFQWLFIGWAAKTIARAVQPNQN
jgi:hypothetical protein